jgi:Holliday junction resolvase
MSSTPQDLALPPIVSLQPGENRVVEYRLKSESKVYKRGQQVMALIHYRQDAQPETTVESPAEQVAFIMR